MLLRDQKQPEFDVQVIWFIQFKVGFRPAAPYVI